MRFGAQAARVSVRLLDGAEAHELTVGFGTRRTAQPVKRMTADGAPVERLLDVEQAARERVHARPARAREGPAGAAPRAPRPGRRRASGRCARTRAGSIRGCSPSATRCSGASARAALGRTLATWDRELAAQALQLQADRAAVVALLAEPFAERATQLGCAGELDARVPTASRALTQDELVAELRERLPGDLERGFTGHGPHRDELAIVRDRRELRVYGSQGEQRLALLALLLAERVVLAANAGACPLMLLDDVMSELDAERRELLARELRTGGQSVIATTDLAHVPGAMDASVARLRVSPGSDPPGGDRRVSRPLPDP